MVYLSLLFLVSWRLDSEASVYVARPAQQEFGVSKLDVYDGCAQDELLLLWHGRGPTGELLLSDCSALYFCYIRLGDCILRYMGRTGS